MRANGMGRPQKDGLREEAWVRPGRRDDRAVWAENSRGPGKWSVDSICRGGNMARGGLRAYRLLPQGKHDRECMLHSLRGYLFT